MSDNFIDTLFILMCSDVPDESYFTEVKDLSHSSVRSYLNSLNWIVLESSFVCENNLEAKVCTPAHLPLLCCWFFVFSSFYIF